MLQVCAKEYGWSYNDMLKMPKRILFRFYGYYIIELIERAEEHEKEESKRAREERMNDPSVKWKSL